MLTRELRVDQSANHMGGYFDVLYPDEYFGGSVSQSFSQPIDQNHDVDRLLTNSNLACNLTSTDRCISLQRR